MSGRHKEFILDWKMRFPRIQFPTPNPIQPELMDGASIIDLFSIVCYSRVYRAGESLTGCFSKRRAAAIAVPCLLAIVTYIMHCRNLLDVCISGNPFVSPLSCVHVHEQSPKGKEESPVKYASISNLDGTISPPLSLFTPAAYSWHQEKWHQALDILIHSV